MARYKVTYQLGISGNGPEWVNAAYYSIEDAFVTFKDDKGKLLASIAAGTIWSIERETN